MGRNSVRVPESCKQAVWLGPPPCAGSQRIGEPGKVEA